MVMAGFQAYTQKAETGELTQADYDQMKSWGLNTVMSRCWWGDDLEPDKTLPSQSLGSTCNWSINLGRNSISRCLRR